MTHFGTVQMCRSRSPLAQRPGSITGVTGAGDTATERLSRSQRRAERRESAERIMRARSWNRDLDQACLRLTVRSLWRDMVGWAGVFVAILVVGGAFLIVWGSAVPQAFSALCVVATAPFAGLFLVGSWGDSWLSRIRHRGRGIAGHPTYRRALFLALIVRPVRTAAVLAVIWLVAGLAIVAIFVR